jgi:hypothetical protein
MSDYELNVPVDVRVCPTCGMSIWAGGEIEVPGDPNVDEIITAVQMEIAKRTEEAIIEHYMVERVRDALVNYGTWRMQKPRREKALAALDSLTAAYGKMEKERDEWEQRYTELLEAVGGTWPG